MNNFEVTNTYSTKNLTVKHILTGEQLQDVINFFKPEWATAKAMVTWGREQTYITWDRDLETRPYLP